MSNITPVTNIPAIPSVQVPIDVPTQAAGVPSGAQITVQDIIRILKKHAGLIVAIFIAILILTAIITFIWAKWFPSYTAIALVEVKTPTPPPALGGERQTVNRDIIEQYINTQANLIRSLGTLQKALADPQIKQTSWYKSFNNDVTEALIDMQDRFFASPIRDTWFISVGFSWRNPKECATIVNVVLDTYLREQAESSKGRTRNELREYERKAAQLRDEIDRKVTQLEQFRATRNIPLIEQRRARIGEEVAVLTQLLTEAEAEKDQAQALYDMYNQPNARENIAATPEMRQLIDADYLIRVYRSQLSDLEVQLASLEEKGPNHRLVAELKTRIESVKKKLAQREAQLISDTFKDMRERTKVQLDTVNTRIMGLRTRLAEAKLELSDLESQLAQYLNAQQEIEALREQLKNVEEYILKLRIQLDNPELVRVSLAAPAVRPLERSLPQWYINIPVGIVLGLVLGMGLAFLIEYLPTTIKSPSELVRQLNLAVLGQIPSQEDDEQTMNKDMYKILVEAPDSVTAENFRHLRTNFLFSAPEDQRKSILVTSCFPEEGKTFIISNMALSLALLGKRVLLVDANFRRPTLSKVFNIKNDKGLSNVLVGNVNADELIITTNYENLDILPSGPLPPNSAELLGRGHLNDFLSHYSHKYDAILFDGPPLLVVSDGLVVSSAVNGVIMVIRAEHSSRGAIQRARGLLLKADAKLLGVVLNDVRASRGGYYREMYRTYYEYQSSSKTLPTGQEEK